MTNVLALADLYKEPIDGLSVDRVLQEITHKDMCHGWGVGVGGGGEGCSRTHEWCSYLPVARLRRWDKQRLGILHYEKLTGLALQQEQQPEHLAGASFLSFFFFFKHTFTLEWKHWGSRGPRTHLVLTGGSDKRRPLQCGHVESAVHFSVCDSSCESKAPRDPQASAPNHQPPEDELTC